MITVNKSIRRCFLDISQEYIIIDEKRLAEILNQHYLYTDNEVVNENIKALNIQCPREYLNDTIIIQKDNNFIKVSDNLYFNKIKFQKDAWLLENDGIIKSGGDKLSAFIGKLNYLIDKRYYKNINITKDKNGNYQLNHQPNNSKRQFYYPLDVDDNTFNRAKPFIPEYIKVKV